MKRKDKGDVRWYVPNKKRPIAYSTRAVSDAIALFSESGGTIEEVRSQIHYNPEAIEILTKYIELGYGNVVAREWFKY